jgi:acetyltransferase-like isoleucine patch superfamily enzyme
MSFRLTSLLRRALRSAVYRWDALVIQPWLNSLGVAFGGKNQFVGVPEITFQSPGQISIGKGGLYVSRNFSTALGVNHPIVIRTLFAGARIEIGNAVGISGGSICAAKHIQIGNCCLFGADVIIADTDFHPLDANLRHDSSLSEVHARPVKIGDNVFIGTRSIILKGVTIGENSIIGAGSVVTSDIPANSIAAGNPAKVIRALL